MAVSAGKALKRHRDLLYRKAIEKLQSQQTLSKDELQEVQRREKLDAGNETMFENMDQAAAAMGFSKAQIRWSKKQNAPGFYAHRINPAELLPWLQEQESKMQLEGEDKGSLELRKLRLQCEKLDVERTQLLDEHMSVMEHNSVTADMVATIQAATYALCASLPPELSGRSMPDLEKVLRKTLDDMWRGIKTK